MNKIYRKFKIIIHLFTLWILNEIVQLAENWQKHTDCRCLFWSRDDTVNCQLSTTTFSVFMAVSSRTVTMYAIGHFAGQPNINCQSYRLQCKKSCENKLDMRHRGTAGCLITIRSKIKYCRFVIKKGRISYLAIFFDLSAAIETFHTSVNGQVHE